ncbi:MAG: oxygen-dependent coproporphyrinogen oxidase [Neomegalonema sp.]|nr:oxygen-dependent coproporphyrinogen oxidase [Neomegalonema sp.]
MSADSAQQEHRKDQASQWFYGLRDEICARFEALEDALTDGPFADLPAGRFERSQTKRASEDGSDAGGGEMSVMRGRVFEKVGVNVSTVYGQLSERAQAAFTARKDIPGLAQDPRFWASGISLVAHTRNPRVPAVHMNTRHFWTPAGSWFGGGSDLNPMIPFDDPAVIADRQDFHMVLKEACAPHGADYYDRFKKWADDYFMIKHWNEARGVGGIFFDDLDTGNWDEDFAFVKAVGSAFLPSFVPLVERRMRENFTDQEKEFQLFRRGRYAEFNLVYDRGTHFGLATGHNPAAVLMSLPPLASWA